MKTHIRDAESSDAQGINILNRDCLGYDFPLESAQERLAFLLRSKGHKVIAAERGVELAGYIHLCDYDLSYSEPYKNIMGIAVLPQYRGQGLGRMLLAAGEKWALETGAHGIRLVSGESRTGAHAFYKSCGYTLNRRQVNISKALINE